MPQSQGTVGEGVMRKDLKVVEKREMKQRLEKKVEKRARKAVLQVNLEDREEKGKTKSRIL